MGRSPCCFKEGLNRGAWTALEDKILIAYIKAHGEGKWRNLPKKAGLKRCGKSCRLRWLNYLRPDIKRGNISHDEEELIIRLHNLLGNRWSLIAGRLPGRTDNEIKNYWNTTLGKKANAQSLSSPPPPPQPKPKLQSPSGKSRHKKPVTDEEAIKTSKEHSSGSPQQPATQVIRTKATKCTKVMVQSSQLQSPPPPPPPVPRLRDVDQPAAMHPPRDSLTNHNQVAEGSAFHFDLLEELGRDQEGSNFLNFDSPEVEAVSNEAAKMDSEYDQNDVINSGPEQCLAVEESVFKDWTATSLSPGDNATFDLDSLSFLLDSEDWPFT